MKVMNSPLIEAKRRFDESFINQTYFTGLPRESIKRCDYLVNVMIYFQEQNQGLFETIALKHKLNNNELKSAVLKDLLAEPTSNNLKKKGSGNSGAMITPPESPGPTPADLELQQAQEAEIESLTEELSRLTQDMKNITSRNEMFERETKKAQEYVKQRDLKVLDNKLLEMKKQLEEVEEEYNLLKSI